MSNRRNIGGALALSALLAVASLPAEAAQAPDFSGFWLYNREQSTGVPRAALQGEDLASEAVFPPVTGNEPVPVRPELVPAMRAKRKHNDDNGLLEERTAKCLATNNFDAMTWSEPIDIVQRDDEIAIVPERERSLPRHIYIGGRHPADLALSINGHSIGHWEGDTLVVDTIGLDPQTAIFSSGYLPHSDKLHVSERIHLANGGKQLVAEWIFEDPAVLTKPWHVNIRYDRGPADMQAIEAVCDVDYRGLEPRK